MRKKTHTFKQSPNEIQLQPILIKTHFSYNILYILNAEQSQLKIGLQNIYLTKNIHKHGYQLNSQMMITHTQHVRLHTENTQN